MSYKFEKPLRLIELFAGYGSQALALDYLKIPYESWAVCEFEPAAVQSYNDLHGTNFPVSDVREWTSEDLNVIDTDQYKYLLTYSFPCQDLSLAGVQRGMIKGSNTRSSLLWEVQRLLQECKDSEKYDLPQYLVMENVPQVCADKNLGPFTEWCQFLCDLGYDNYYKILDAQDYGIPQHRERCFMVSILKSEGKKFAFPKKQPLMKTVRDYLETDIDLSEYILSDELLNSIRTTTFKARNFVTLNVKGDVVPTLLATDYKGPQFKKIIRVGTCEAYSYEQSQRIYSSSGVIVTLPSTAVDDAIIKIQDHDKYRQLTEHEYFRLMGVRDEDYAKLTVSKKNRYKQAGNSIVVDVLMAIFTNLFLNDCKVNKLF